MRIPRIFVDQSLEPHAEVVLEGAAVRHLVSALRLKPGASLVVFNGDGGEYAARLATLQNKKAVVQLGTRDPGIAQSPLSITLLAGLARGERMDLLVQKSVELGVSELVPVLTQRCEVRLDQSRLARKMRHWREIARSACEQCGQNTVPVIAQPQKLTEVLAAAPRPGFVLHPESPLSFSAACAGQRSAVTRVSVLTGPEGGLSEPEVAAAEAAGFLSCRLGPRVLRAETAPLVAAALLQQIWGDFV